MFTWLTTGKLWVLTFSLVFFDGILMYGFLYPTQVLPSDSSTWDFRVTELRQLDARIAPSADHALDHTLGPILPIASSSASLTPTKMFAPLSILPAPAPGSDLADSQGRIL
jgi:hypothetical protein